MEIHEKQVFVVEDHASALLAWAEVKQTHTNPLYLVSLDYHSDDHDAFKSAYCRKMGGPVDDHFPEYKRQRLREIDVDDWNSLRKETHDLKNDEQIDAAINLGILGGAIVVCIQHSHGTDSVEVAEWRKHQLPLERLLWQTQKRQKRKWWPFRKGCKDTGHKHNNGTDDPKPKPPYTYSKPSNGIFRLDPRDVIELPQFEHIEDHILEAWCWKTMIDHALNPMAHAFGFAGLREMPYVFDVDLDIFISQRAINPRWCDWFYGIIFDAVAVTVARERSFVDSLKREDNLTCQYLEDRLLLHIDRAITRAE